MAHRPAVLGVFEYVDDVVKAVGSLSERNVAVHTVYSPIPHHEILDALGLKPSPVRYFTLLGGILGIITGVGLLVYTCLQWKFIVSGKPVVPFVPAVIVGFEFCILLGVLFNTAGMLFNSRLPKFRLPAHYDHRFAQDRFGVLAVCSEAEREGVSRIMREAGAEEVHDVES